MQEDEKKRNEIKAESIQLYSGLYSDGVIDANEYRSLVSPLIGLENRIITNGAE